MLWNSDTTLFVQTCLCVIYFAVFALHNLTTTLELINLIQIVLLAVKAVHANGWLDVTKLVGIGHFSKADTFLFSLCWN